MKILKTKFHLTDILVYICFNTKIIQKIFIYLNMENHKMEKDDYKNIFKRKNLKIMKLKFYIRFMLIQIILHKQKMI